MLGRVKASVEGLQLLEVESVEIHESLNAYPSATLDCLVAQSMVDAIATVGASIVVEHGAEQLFHGVIEAVNVKRHAKQTRVAISAVHSVACHDRLPQRRIFGRGDSPREIWKLNGLAEEILSPMGVSGKEKLRNLVMTVVQAGETNWSTLIRVVSQCEGYVRVDHRGVQILHFKDDVQPIILQGDAIDALTATARWVSQTSLSHRWDRATGAIEEPEQLSWPVSKGTIGDVLGKVPSLGAEAVDCPLEQPLPGAARVGRAALLKVKAFEQFTLSFAVRGESNGTRVGNLIRLPRECGFEGQDLLVCRARTVQLPTESKREVTCVLAGTLPHAPFHRGVSTQLWLGRVCESPTTASFGRLAVKFAAGMSESAVECDVLHAFAGTDGKSVAGTWNVPSLDDWVVALVNPTSFSVPVILGSLYRGNAKAVDVSDGARVLCALGAARIEVDSSGSSIVLSISGSGDTRSIRIDQSGITGTGPMFLHGTLDVGSKS